MKANDKDLEAYINLFYGFGNLDSCIWFIGQEEAGSAKDIEARVSAWSKLNKLNVLDIYKFHSEFANQLGKPNRFEYLFGGKDAKLQATWKGLIKLQLAIKKGILISDEALKEFQSYKIGREDSQNALLELFPLPSPDYKSHDYSTVSDLPYLKTKEEYKATVAPIRIEFLKNTIAAKKPKFVIFYSTSKEFITYWKQVANIENRRKWEKVKIEGRNKGNRYLLLNKNEATTFCITQHTTYTGTSDEELLESGLIIKKFSEQNI